MSQIKLKYDTAPKTSRGTKLFRTVLFLIFLLLVGYFVVSSAWFLQSVIVPRIGKALNPPSPSGMWSFARSAN